MTSRDSPDDDDVMIIDDDDYMDDLFESSKDEKEVIIMTKLMLTDHLFDRNLYSASFFFSSIHTGTQSLEDYEQAYIVHTGFAGLWWWSPEDRRADARLILFGVWVNSAHNKLGP